MKLCLKLKNRNNEMKNVVFIFSTLKNGANFFILIEIVIIAMLKQNKLAA